MNVRGLSGNGRGSVPFSAVAVTILVLVSAWAVSVHGLGGNDGEEEEIGKELAELEEMLK